jgi:hypothetical protein
MEPFLFRAIGLPAAGMAFSLVSIFEAERRMFLPNVIMGRDGEGADWLALPYGLLSDRRTTSGR